jgi:tetratricopeptide (TPR) repeat protein
MTKQVATGKRPSLKPETILPNNIIEPKIRNVILIGTVLAVITLAVYMQAGNHQFVNYDDYAYVTKNPHVVNGITGNNIEWAFTSVEASNWHPITWLSHMADVQLYGMNPRGHHLTNVAIHIVSSLLLLLFLFRLTGSLWKSSFVAALFALHPLHVESVAWIAERKDVLSAFFWFLTLIFYAEYVLKRKRALYLLALFFFVLGLMSKPMLVTLPVIMLLIDFWPLNRYRHEEKQGLRQLSRRVLALVKEKFLFFAFSIISCAVTIYAQHKGGAMSSLDVITFWLRIENALISYVKYIGKTVWPHDLAVLYLFSLSLPLWQVIGSMLLLLIVSGATIRLRHRHPYLAVGWFWFLVTLVPVIGLIHVGNQSMADRYTYIPLTGLFIMAAWGVPDLTKGVRHRADILALLASAVIIASAALTWQQLGYWRDDISLYRHALQVTSGNYVIHLNLGSALAERGDIETAIHEYREAIQIHPNYSDAHYELGIVLAVKGAMDAAIHEFQDAIRINRKNTAAHYNLGLAFVSKGNLDEAVKEFHRAIQESPNNTAAHYDLGLALVEKGNLDAAIQEFHETIRINPNDTKAHNNLGIVLAEKSEVGSAIQEFQEALRISPNNTDARNNLSRALAQLKRQDKTRK